MAIIILLAVVLAMGAFLWLSFIRLLQIASLLVIAVMATATIGIGGISLLIGAASFGLFYQMFGEHYVGLCVSLAILVGLATAWGMVKAVAREVIRFSVNVRSKF